MKLVRILQDVTIPNSPGFRKGQQVRVSDSLGDLLLKRGLAKLEKGKSENKVKSEKAEKAKSLTKKGKVETEEKNSSDVTVSKIKGKTK